MAPKRQTKPLAKSGRKSPFPRNITSKIRNDVDDYKKSAQMMKTMAEKITGTSESAKMERHELMENAKKFESIANTLIGISNSTVPVASSSSSPPVRAAPVIDLTHSDEDDGTDNIVDYNLPSPPSYRPDLLFDLPSPPTNVPVLSNIPAPTYKDLFQKLDLYFANKNDANTADLVKAIVGYKQHNDIKSIQKLGEQIARDAKRAGYSNGIAAAYFTKLKMALTQFQKKRMISKSMNRLQQSIDNRTGQCAGANNKRRASPSLEPFLDNKSFKSDDMMSDSYRTNQIIQNAKNISSCARKNMMAAGMTKSYLLNSVIHYIQLLKQYEMSKSMQRDTFLAPLEDDAHVLAARESIILAIDHFQDETCNTNNTDLYMFLLPEAKEQKISEQMLRFYVDVLFKISDNCIGCDPIICKCNYALLEEKFVKTYDKLVQSEKSWFGGIYNFFTGK